MLFSVSHEPSVPYQFLSGMSSSKRWNACIGFPSLAFPYVEPDYLWPSFDMDCLLALWPLLLLVSLVTCKVWSFDLYLKKLPCNTVYIFTQNSIKHPCSTRDLGLHVLLSLSPSVSLSGWFSGEWKSVELIFLPGLSRLLERAPCAYVSSTSSILGLYWFSA